MNGHWRRSLVLMGLVLSLAGSVSAEPQRPNIVLLYADDMGYGDLGAQNGDSRIPTPHLDRLAREGMRFTDAHSSSGICTPSRYALLHGRYHWRKFHGIVNSFGPSVMDAERVTLAELLKQSGYRTACIGKWHLGWDWQAIRRPGATRQQRGFSAETFDWSKPIPGGPLAHGFDYYFGDDVPNFPPYAWIEHDRVITPPTVALTTTSKPAEGHWEARPGPSVEGWKFEAVMPRLTEKAVEWIGQQSTDQPFFLYFPFTSPHAPIVPTEEFVGSSQAGSYGDYMTQTDWTVGQFLQALEEGELADNTLVIFSSDNGPEHYAYARVRATGHRSMGPLRGLKRDLWEGGHRVPLLVRWPGVVAAGQVSDGLLSQVDLLATLAAVVGYQIPSGSAEDSQNQLPLWTGQGASARDTVIHNTTSDGYAIRHGDWLLIRAKSGGVSKVPGWYNQAQGYRRHDTPGELYNLRDDLGQKVNLYREQPEKVAELTARLEAALRQANQ